MSPPSSELPPQFRSSALKIHVNQGSIVYRDSGTGNRTQSENPSSLDVLQAVRTSEDSTQQIIGWIGKRLAALVMLHAKNRSVLFPLEY